MQTKTKTNIGELNKGDRFYFVSDKKRTAYEITECTGNFRAYNLKILDRSVWKFDKVDPGKRMVVFLRSILN